MTPLLTVAIIIAIIAVIAFLIWWLIFESEGIYLGKRMVIWLYDIYANRYDVIKGFDDVDEHLLLAQPIMARLSPHTNPLVLDVATGTGRLPLALCQHARFEGHIIGLDASHKMLAIAQQKIADEHFDDFVTFQMGDGTQLPFDDASFDMVTCLEALEFMPYPEQALAECSRVLRPGGTLLTTQRINTRWLPGKVWAEEKFQELLEEQQIQAIEFQTWMTDYKLVWGKKAGESAFIGK
jgi:ubiquinone/menaquinone biosynthesis C-methylase UbiE